MQGMSVSLAVGLILSAGVACAACDKAATVCEVAGGTYHLLRPDGASADVPAVMMLHGYGGDGQGSIRNAGLVDVLLARGYAVIAPDGQLRDSGQGRNWDFHPDRPATRDETAFLMAVADDAAEKHAIDRDKIILAGFSIGGSMTSYVACANPDAFAAYAPLAGSFWRPHPTQCAGPVRLLHTHGTADRTVPMLGREIYPGFVQGNVYEAMDIWRATNSCRAAEPDATETLDLFAVERWTSCATGARLDVALHDGGHSMPKGWGKMVLDWFEQP